MIDIHSHVIPRVDDGSKSLEDSLKLLKTAEEDGVTDLICTPHYRRSFFETPKAKIEEKFEELKAANNTKVNIYLGQEIAYSRDIYGKLERGELLTYNGTKYILLEFNYTNFVDVSGVCFECKIRGFKPIIAHIERYDYLSLKDVIELYDNGFLIQVNASSLLFGSHYRGKVKKYLKNDLVHFIANDIHVGRDYCMAKAYNIVKSKYGEERAEALFNENAKILIEKNGD